MRFLLLALVLVSPLCLAKTVVVIQSYHIEYKWDADYIAAVQSVLGDSHDIHVFELDTKRLAKPEWPKKVADIQKAIADIEPDVAILGDDNAFSLMADHLVEREIPVVFLGVNGGTGAHERYDAVVLGTHHTIRDQDGEYVTPQELLEEAFHKAQLPLFSFWDIFVGEKQSIGGFTISDHQEGLTAAAWRR